MTRADLEAAIVKAKGAATASLDRAKYYDDAGNLESADRARAVMDGALDQLLDLWLANAMEAT